MYTYVNSSTHINVTIETDMSSDGNNCFLNNRRAQINLLYIDR